MIPHATKTNLFDVRRAARKQLSEILHQPCLALWRDDVGRGLMCGGVGQTRDSGPEEISNFRTAQKLFRDAGVEPVTLSFSHWACGWIEELAVPATIRAADVLASIQESLESYPVLDDDDVAQVEEEDFGGRCGACGETGHHDNEDGNGCGAENEVCAVCRTLLFDPVEYGTKGYCRDHEPDDVDA